LLTFLLKQLLKWGACGAVGGVAVAFFLYQKVSPSFECSVVLRLVPTSSNAVFDQETADDNDLQRTPEVILMSADLLYPAVQVLGPVTTAKSVSVQGQSQLIIGEKEQAIVSAFLLDDAFKVHRLGSSEANGIYRVSYKDSLPSRTESFISAYAKSAELTLNVTAQHAGDIKVLDRLILLKSDSESRIQRLKEQLIELPIDSEARWVDGSVVSPTTIQWDHLQHEADRLHQRKAMLQEQLIRVRAEQMVEATSEMVNRHDGTEEPVNADQTVAKFATEDRLPVITSGSIPSKSTSSFDVQSRGASAAAGEMMPVTMKMEYLEKQIELIFEQHLEISHQMRTLARRIDLEEQMAFEAFSLRNELAQELTIRDRLLSEISTPALMKSDYGHSIEIIEAASTPVQVEPNLRNYLMTGGLAGSGLLIMLAGFVVAVGFEEPA